MDRAGIESGLDVAPPPGSGLCDAWSAGPLRIEIRSESSEHSGMILAQLRRLGIAWPGPGVPVELRIVEQDPPEGAATGRYLSCARLKADSRPEQLWATTLSGAWARWTAGAGWRIGVPAGAARDGIAGDVGELVYLLLTTEWRRQGWIPFHVGTVIAGQATALVCGQSCSGKSTFVTAALESGLATLGDDKALIALGPDGRAQAAALSDHFNLDPAAARWFPCLEGLEALPLASRWTDKRVVPIADFWPARLRVRSVPTHVIRLERHRGPGPLTVAELDAAQVLSTLFRQTVIPADRTVARQILPVLTRLAGQVRGLRVTVGLDSYARPRPLATLLHALGDGEMPESSNSTETFAP